MNKVVEKIFSEIVKEAKNCCITYNEILYGQTFECKFRMGFNVVYNNEEDEKLFNFYIHNYDDFIKKLTEYVYTVINFYNLDHSDNTIKIILILIWSNITKEEMLNIDDYVQKYIDFYNNNLFNELSGKKEIDGIGKLCYNFTTQSIKQETPLCFNTYFQNDENIYYLPRISYGIKNNVCYIYAVQNKDTNEDNDYCISVKRALNTLNSGVKKYRNVTPSALASLSLFISLLNDNGIYNFEVVCNLPIRHQNRELVDDYKLQIQSVTKDNSDLDRLKEIMKDKRLKIYNNTTHKFKNNFKRLGNHFKLILNYPENEVSENLFLKVISLDTSNSLFKQIVENNDNYVIK